MKHPNALQPNSVSQEVSSKIANMSLLGALLVISIHCGYSKSESGICWLVHQMFSGGYSRIAVPFFFLVSGYFLATHINEGGWWKSETLKRVRSLLIPFFTWAFLYQVLFIPLSIYADYRAGRPFGYNISFLNDNALCVFGLEWDKWPTSVPLWFLRSLFLFVLVSPIVAWAVRKCPKCWVLGLFVCSFLMGYAPDPELGGWSGFCQHVFSINGLMYFSLGMCLRVKDIHLDSRRIAIGAGVVGVMLLVVKGILVYCGVQKYIPLAIIAIPCLMFFTWHFMPTRAMPTWLKGTSFPIYLSHSLFLGYWGIFAKNIGFGESITKLIAWPMAFIGCIILANVLRKSMPRVVSFVFGGR